MVFLTHALQVKDVKHNSSNFSDLAKVTSKWQSGDPTQGHVTPSPTSLPVQHERMELRGTGGARC